MDELGIIKISIYGRSHIFDLSYDIYIDKLLLYESEIIFVHGQMR